MTRIMLAIGCVATSLAGTPALLIAQTQVDVTSRPLELIPPGTVIERGKAPRGWSQTLLVARPRATHGDVRRVSALSVELASMLTHVMLAKRGGEPRRYHLEQIAFGYARPIQGRLTIISSATQQRLGAGLGFIERRVLAEQESYLGNIRRVARTSSMAIIDAKGVVVHRGEHRWMTVRYAVLLEPKRGSIGCLTWLLEGEAADEDAGDGFRLAEENMQFLPANYREDRQLSVREDKYTFGIPADDAFAAVEIPQGTPVPLTHGLADVAATARFTPQSARRLERELWALWRK